VSEYSPGALVNLGTVVGDDVMGIDIAVTPWFFQGGMMYPPSNNYTGLMFTGYDWTAPQAPGEYRFTFQPSPLAPNLRVYPSTGSPNFIEVPTAYLSATLTVIPGAPTVGALVAGMAIAGRRRRR
jgi:hypothetical protein